MPPFSSRQAKALLADVAAAVFALEPGAGRADKAVALGVAFVVPAAVVPAIVVPAAIAAAIIVGVGIALERGGGDRAGGADRGAHGGCCAADRIGRDVARPEAAIAMLPAAVAAIPSVVVPVAVAVDDVALIAAGVGIAGSQVGAIGVRITRLAVRGMADRLLRHRGPGQCGRQDHGGSAE